MTSSGRSSSSSRAPVLLPLLVVAMLLLSSSCSASAASLGGNSWARRLLVSRPSTSRQKAEQQMRVGGWNRPFKQAAASFGRKIPRSGWNPIQNR
ncbi:hypothetical protein BS78_10G241800 [Paspalum vaginatum]|nr:hypothetical protein BS78_10G241800 [Paspalum vaginatum]KAJ1260557.1 hypothetical protein BS78_10G241800 [Paspalum vaginatum]